MTNVRPYEYRPEYAQDSAPRPSLSRSTAEIDAELLIAKIYHAAAGRIPWPVPLTELGTLLDAFVVQLFAVDKQTGGILFSHVGGETPPEPHLDYIRTYHRIDPRSKLSMSGPVNRWVHCHEHFNDEYVANSPFYQDFLIPNGGRYVSVCKLFDEDIALILGIHRGMGKQPLDTDTIKWCNRFCLHLTEAVKIFRHTTTVHRERAVGMLLLDGLQLPVVLVDAMRGLRYANPAARAALASGRYIVDRNGTLGCCRNEDDAGLSSAMIEASTRESGAKSRRYLRLKTDYVSLPVVVCVSQLRPDEVMGAFGELPLTMMVFYDSANKPKLDSFALGEMFDLTPAEANVAIALAAGATAEEIADQRSVAISTIRTQIKSLMQKTSTTRQADLVRHVLSSSLLHRH